MITLLLKDTGAALGTIEEADLKVLVDQLVEETDVDTDYWIDSATIDLLEGAGASANLVALLKNAVGGSEGIEVSWQEA